MCAVVFKLFVANYRRVVIVNVFFLDTNDLKEPEKVRASQEKALHALQQYTLAHYPDMPSKFGELLLRIPDLQRTCQVIWGCSFVGHTYDACCNGVKTISGNSNKFN